MRVLTEMRLILILLSSMFYIASTVLYTIGLFMGIPLLVKNDSWCDFGDYDCYWLSYFSSGVPSMVFHMIAVPIMHCAAHTYTRSRQTQGMKGFMIASWVFLILSFANFLALYFFFTPEEAWLYSVPILFVFPWIFMALHAEAARNQVSNASV